MTTVYEGEVLPAIVGGGELSAEVPDRLKPITAAWLLSVRSRHTRRAYQHDIVLWLTWCQVHELDPLAVQRGHVDMWIRVLEQTPTRYGRPPAVATMARRVSTVASWYTYLVDAGEMVAVPVHSKSMPKVANESTTVGLSRDEARAFRRQLAQESLRDRALVNLGLVDGLRVSEMTDLNIGAMGFNRGHCTVRVAGKGNKVRLVAVGPSVVDSITLYLDERARLAGLPGADALDPELPLFATPAGGRLTQRTVYRIVQRIARAAGVRSWASLSPHGLRHSCATLMLDAGRPLHEVQDQLGHASADTTRRYDRARGSLDRSPVYALESYLAD